MKKTLLLFLFSLSLGIANSQNYYFPPLTGTAWETRTPQSLGWCTEKVDTLYKYLETTNSKAFIVLKDGRIVLEKYFGTFTQDSTWYWASAGKTLTGLTVGIAQQEGFLKIQDTTSKYLGKGWTTAPLSKENLITVRHQLTMTTGLDDGVADSDCTLPSCLKYKADASMRWSYHNAPYTLLDKVVENATGQNYNTYVTNKLRSRIGMNGLFIKTGSNNVHFSTARSMARFGLLLLNKGKWNTTAIVSDTAYMRQMVNSSQNINPSYGYLTWLNGKSALMVPQLQTVFPTSVSPQAPAEMYAAMGKNGQLINIVPSQGLVIIRMGNNPDNALVPFTYNNEVWKRLNLVICNRTAIAENALNTEGVSVYPNPTQGYVSIVSNEEISISKILVINTLGNVVKSQKGVGNSLEIDISDLPKSMYLIQIHSNKGIVTKKIVTK